VALLVHLLAERGQLSLDDRAAGYWPGFGAHGKDRFTIRQILQHRSGLTVARNLISDVLAATDWDEAVRRIEQARPGPRPRSGCPAQRGLLQPPRQPAGGGSWPPPPSTGPGSHPATAR
jgi:CubicO group peptidase (beta-lactamase class C family)